MITKSVSLALFTSTKGHYGHKNVYKKTIENLYKKIDPNFFLEKVAHIKWSEGEEVQRDEMKTWLEYNDFHVIETMGTWKHNDKSHYTEHAKDIVKLMAESKIQNCDFVLWLEDDFIFEEKVWTTEKAITKSIMMLAANPDVVNVRFAKNEKELVELNSSMQEAGFCFHSDVFSFNPCLIRTRDAWLLSLYFERKYLGSEDKIHIERFATEVLKQITRIQIPFCYVDYNNFSCQHIGNPDFDKYEHTY